jgi:general secretion pathway protein M
VLGVGAAVTVVIVVWFFVWSPLRAGVSELRNSVADKQDLLVDVHRAQAVALGQSGASSRGPAATDSLVVLVDKTHRNHGLAGTLSRNQPEGPDRIRLTFQEAPFDSLVGWLGTLQEQYGVGVESASFSAGHDPGVVSATLVLHRS